jgi:toxin ParE1/3/4
MPKSKTEYRLAPKAQEDMEAIWLYSFSVWGLDQANDYFDRFTNAYHLLANNPKSGILSNNIRQGYRKYSLMSHMVYYRETEYGVEIMRILHDRMQASRHP